MTEFTPPNSKPPQIDSVDTKEVERLLFLLGEEMQQIPKGYREAVFKRLAARKGFASQEPGNITPLIIDAFQAGWMNYPQ